MLSRNNFQGAIFESRDLVVDLDRGTVQIGKDEIHLTATEYEVLKVLVLNAGRLLTQRRLTHEVWGKEHDDEALRLLRTTIGTLRENSELIRCVLATSQRNPVWDIVYEPANSIS